MSLLHSTLQLPASALLPQSPGTTPASAILPDGWGAHHPNKYLLKEFFSFNKREIICKENNIHFNIIEWSNVRNYDKLLYVLPPLNFIQTSSKASQLKRMFF